MEVEEKMYPRISIVTPSYNQGQFLEETVLSVLNQNYPNLEYIIMDGGSTDNSLNIIRKYADRLAYWVSEPDKGQTHAINKGLRRATGEILAWLNSDDLLLPHAMAMVMNAFKCFPRAGFVYGDCQVIDRNGLQYYINKVTDFDWSILLYGRILCGQPASFFRRKVIEQIGFLDESYDFCLDLEFWIRAAIQGVEFQPIYCPLAASRLHGDAKTNTIRKRMTKEHKRLMVQYGNIDPNKLEVLHSLYYKVLNRIYRYKGAIQRIRLRKDFGIFRATRARKASSRSGRMLEHHKS